MREFLNDLTTSDPADRAGGWHDAANAAARSRVVPALDRRRLRVYLTSVLLRDFEAMARPALSTTTVSTKGQVILPKAIRESRKWDAGTRLVVEETPEGVLLKLAPVFAPTRSEDVFGMLPHAGPPKSLEEMEAGVLAEARRRHGRD